MTLIDRFIAFINRTFWGSTPSHPDNVENTITEVTMSKKALCVGINDYPGSENDLSGCINDCNDWAKIFAGKYGFGSIEKLQNGQATMKGVKDALTKLVTQSVSGDVLAFTYSGHGSYVVDASGDEPDSKDETIYAYDGHITDDELRAILEKLPAGVNMTVILDSCHSGTATRFVRPGAPKPRFMLPPEDGASKYANLPSKKAMLAESQMKEILFTGCHSTEYSYDANFKGVPNGAFTKTAIDALNKMGNPTCIELFEEIRKKLPSNSYPQTPQFEGATANKTRKVFT